MWLPMRERISIKKTICADKPISMKTSPKIVVNHKRKIAVSKNNKTWIIKYLGLAGG